MKFKLLMMLFLVSSAGYAVNIDFSTALELYKNGQNKESYLIFFQLQEKEPSAEIYFYLGNLSVRLERDDEAWSWYEKGFSFSGSAQENFLFNLGALALKNGKLEKAAFFLDRLSSKTPLVRMILNVIYYQLKNYEKAEEQIKSLIQENHVVPDEFLLQIYENYFFSFLKQNKIYPSIPVANMIRNFPDRSEDFWENFGGILVKTSQISKAQEVFVQLLSTTRSKQEVYEQKLLALLLFYKKQPQEALIYIEKFFKEGNQTPKLVKLSAYAYHLANQAEKAWEVIRGYEPQTREDYAMKGLLAYQAKKMAEAVKILEAGFLVYSDDEILLSALVSIYIREKQFRQMEFLVRFYQEKNKTDRFTLWLFQLALTEDQIDRARELGERILNSQEEKDQAFFYNLGKVYEKQGDFVKATAFYEKSKALAPDFPYPYVALAGILTASGKYDEAADHYLIAIKLLPEYGVYYYQLAQVYALTENYFLAKEFFKQAAYRGFSREIILEDPLTEPVKKRFPGFQKELENS